MPTVSTPEFNALLSIMESKNISYAAAKTAGRISVSKRRIGLLVYAVIAVTRNDPDTGTTSQQEIVLPMTDFQVIDDVYTAELAYVAGKRTRERNIKTDLDAIPDPS